jgi:hypothetical protein
MSALLSRSAARCSKLTIQVGPPRQPGNQRQIPNKQDPANEPTPAENDMHHEQKRKQQARLPRMEAHVVTLVLKNKQQDAASRRQQQVRQASLPVQAPAERRREHVDVLTRGREARGRRHGRGRGRPCCALRGCRRRSAEVVVLRVVARRGEGAWAVERDVRGDERGREGALRLGDVLVRREGCSHGCAGEGAGADAGRGRGEDGVLGRAVQGSTW